MLLCVMYINTLCVCVCVCVHARVSVVVGLLAIHCLYWHTWVNFILQLI